MWQGQGCSRGGRGGGRPLLHGGGAGSPSCEAVLGGDDDCAGLAQLWPCRQRWDPTAVRAECQSPPLHPIPSTSSPSLSPPHPVPLTRLGVGDDDHIGVAEGEVGGELQRLCGVEVPGQRDAGKGLRYLQALHGPAVPDAMGRRLNSCRRGSREAGRGRGVGPPRAPPDTFLAGDRGQLRGASMRGARPRGWGCDGEHMAEPTGDVGSAEGLRAPVGLGELRSFTGSIGNREMPAPCCALYGGGLGALWLCSLCCRGVSSLAPPG